MMGFEIERVTIMMIMQFIIWIWILE